VATAGMAGLNSFMNGNMNLRALKTNVAKSARRVSMGLHGLNSASSSRSEEDEHDDEIRSRLVSPPEPSASPDSETMAAHAADGLPLNAVAANPLAVVAAVDDGKGEPEDGAL